MSDPLYPAPPGRGLGVLGGLRYLVLPVLLLVAIGAWGRSVAGALAVYVVVSLGIGGTITALEVLLMPRLLRRRPGALARGALLTGEVAVAVVVGSELGVQLSRVILEAELPRLEVLRIAVVVTLAVLAFDHLRGRAREAALREQSARASAALSQLAALQARVDRHFLFNTLNTVASLIPEDPALAERCLERLSELLRRALDAPRGDVTLAEELSLARSYLEIEALRLGARLHFEIEAEPGVEAVRVPALLLQPIVENAVLHGVAPRREGGSVRVRAWREEGGVVLSVQDDGPGPGASPHRGAGVALSDLRERLRARWGDRAALEEERLATGYRVSLRLREAAA